jgi:xanthine dehydrogenase YagS FAD-binding subunit
MTAPSFRYTRASGVDAALSAAAGSGAMYLAGGTDLLPLCKSAVVRPAHVVDISRLALSTINSTEEGLELGALARLSDVARDSAVVGKYGLIAQAIANSASGQIRNMATVGGNLLQRTRCPYFRSADLPCNKREAGSGCGALAGENRQAALFGGSASCVATHPSDLAVALFALDAEVAIAGQSGERRVPLARLYRLPADVAEQDTTLGQGELIKAVLVPNATRFASRSTFLKIRDRASFEFAVVSVAAALRVNAGTIVEARLVAGAVAPMPWRLSASVNELIGRPANDATFAAAARAAASGAQPLAQNGFKIELLRRAVARALQDLAGRHD